MSATSELVRREQALASLLPTGDARCDRARLLGELSAYAMSCVAEAQRRGHVVPDAGEIARARVWLWRPVFLCGHHRSGTTLLHGLLDGHPDLLVLPSEGTYFTSFRYVTGERPSVRHLEKFIAEWISRLVDPNFEPHFRLGRSDETSQPYVELARRFFGWHAALRTTAPGSFAPLLALVAAFKGAMNAPDPSRWAEKTPLNEHHVRKLAAFTEARFIHSVRHPDTTLASLRELYRGHSRDEFDADKHARAIADSLRLAHVNQQRFDARYLVVRYENLANATAHEMERVRSFLELAPNASLDTPTAGGSPLRSNSSFDRGDAGVVNRARAAVPAPAADLGAISVFAGDAARVLGYDIVRAGVATSLAIRLRGMSRRLFQSLRSGLRSRECWLMAGSTLFGLAVLELTLRAWFPLSASPYQPDDVSLTKLVPGAHKLFIRSAVNGGQRVVSVVNGEGYRGEDLLPAVANRRRVVVYGDSNVQAEFSTLDATFPEQLERRLHSAFGVPVEVINAGVVGDGPDQVTLRLARDAGNLGASLAVVVIYADNDFGDLLRNRIYRLNASGEIGRATYRLPDALRAQMLRAAFPTGLRRLQLYRHSAQLWNQIRARRHDGFSIDTYLANYVETSLARSEAAYRRFLAAPDDGQAENPFHDYYDADIALTPDSPSARLKVALMGNALVRLRDTAAAVSLPLVLLILPSPIDASESYDIRVDIARWPQYDRTRLSGLVATLASRANLANLNLLTALRTVDADALYFHGGDDHWNDDGQAFAATTLVEFIRRHPQLAQPFAGSSPNGP